MKIISPFFLSATVISILALSCTKTKIETVTTITTVKDTVQVRSIDTTIKTNSVNWNAFSYQTLGLVDSGTSTYQTTAEGIKMIGQSPRLGIRVQTKSELAFHNKVLYFKWKGTGGGQFATFVPQIKYDILSNDGLPQIQGVDLGFFSVSNTTIYSILVQENTWYYTRVVPVTGTDNFQVITSTGNYNNAGGNVILTRMVTIYTKSGYLAFRIGDPFGGAVSNAVLGECKIASN